MWGGVGDTGDTVAGGLRHRSPRRLTGRRTAAVERQLRCTMKKLGVLIAEEEHRRDGVAHPHHLLVDVDTPGTQIGVVGVDVLAEEGHAGGDPDRFALLRRHQRERRAAPGGHFHPAVALTEGDVGALLEPELAG